ncbi:protein kinase domain-containing protein [Chamaesiphon sp. VAR_48_metabat_403]|uniref:protein kinase domain-containing protein n=1 Tax=Chamaesiphon sp. VAR_48_metabat_403 TaxID=2964700 RepID=UPI00286E627B|nr:ankyrin repeat domain-containing protein [Chamaesiphon sp. VAR_48_metabat_403]
MKSSSTYPSQVIARSDTPEALCYSILDILGEGGSGVTYRALDTKNQQLVALKALSLHQIDDWKAIELFEREAKILSTLDRDGIPKYLDYFTTDLNGDRYFYIVQELAPGKNLLEWMRSGWRVSEAEVKTIAIQILEILIYLHRHYPPIVHRDLKPSNIIKTEDGKIFLVDFGAVQQTYHDTFLRGSTVVGTYGYMAPEQFRGQAVPATDLYGLGATILHLLTHRSPAEIPQDGLRLNFRDRLQVSSSFADWLERMLEPDVGSRFSSSTKALEVLKTPPKSKSKPKFSTLDRTLIGMTGLMVLAAIFWTLDRSKYTLLSMAGFISNEPFKAMSERPSVDRLKYYLDRGFNVNTLDINRRSLMYHAIQNDLPDVVVFLIDRGADISDSANLIQQQEDKLKSIRESKKIAEEMLDKGYVANRGKLKQENEERLRHEEEIISNTSINNIAYYAIVKNRIAVLKVLIDRGVKIDRIYPDENRLSFLHLASVHQDGEIVKLLLDRGVDPNIKDSFGCTPLHTAIVRNLMPYAPRLSSYINSINAANDSISKQSVVYLASAGAKSNTTCRLNNEGYRYADTQDRSTAIPSLIRSKYRLYYPQDITDRTTPANLLLLFDITDINFDAYPQSK